MCLVVFFSQALMPHSFQQQARLRRSLAGFSAAAGEEINYGSSIPLRGAIKRLQQQSP